MDDVRTQIIEQQHATDGQHKTLQQIAAVTLAIRRCLNSCGRLRSCVDPEENTCTSDSSDDEESSTTSSSGINGSHTTSRGGGKSSDSSWSLPIEFTVQDLTHGAVVEQYMPVVHAKNSTLCGVLNKVKQAIDSIACSSGERSADHQQQQQQYHQQQQQQQQQDRQYICLSDWNPLVLVCLGGSTTHVLDVELTKQQWLQHIIEVSTSNMIRFKRIESQNINKSNNQSIKESIQIKINLNQQINKSTINHQPSSEN